MKKILILCLFVLVSCQQNKPVVQSTLTWQNDWKVAAAQAKQEKRLMIAEFSTEWCHYCKYVKEQVFPNPAVSEKLESFVLLHVDGDEAKSQTLMTEHKIVGFPTFLFFDHKGNEILRINDINSPPEFLTLLSDLENRRTEVSDLRSADAFYISGDKKKAAAVYKSVFKRVAMEDPLREAALWGYVSTFDGSKEEKVKYYKELLKIYPTSIYRPDYFKELAELYSSNGIKNSLRKSAVELIEERLKDPWKHSQKMQRILLDQHVALLADLYKDLGQYDKVNDVYFRGATLCEKKIKRTGGLKNNQNLLGAVGYYYRKAGEPEKAIRFLKRAAKEMPDYWPIYSKLAQALGANGDYDEAIVQAEKSYGLAKEVAKSRVSKLLAELYASQGNHDKAVQALQTGIDYLNQMKGANKGRASKMVASLEERIADYKLDYD